MTIFVTPPPKGHTRIPVETAIRQAVIALWAALGNPEQVSVDDAGDLIVRAIRESGWKHVPDEGYSGHDRALRAVRPDSVNDLRSK